jgi:hypothetical protein
LLRLPGRCYEKRAERGRDDTPESGTFHDHTVDPAIASGAGQGATAVLV